MPERDNRNGNLFRELRIEANAVDAERRTAALSFSSETPYTRWWGPEILLHEAGAIDLSRLQEIGVLLFNHDRDMPIGAVESVELDEMEHRCKAIVRFDDDPESDKIFKKVQNGTLKGVSVGYRVQNWEEVEQGAVSVNGRFTGPCSIAMRWEPYEISIVSVPADPTVGVGRSENNILHKEGTEMPNQNPQSNVLTAEQQRAQATNEERTRVLEINALCAAHNVTASDCQRYLQEGTTVEEVRRLVLEQISARNTPTQISIGEDERDKFRSAVTDGLALRAGLTLDRPADGAEQFRGKRLLRIAGEYLQRFHGVNPDRMNDEALVREVLASTSALPGILGNVANKSLLQAYATAPTTYQFWTAKGSNNDFKAATRYRLSEADELKPLKQNGEFEDSSMQEAASTAKIATFGRSFGFTREALINDDMAALSTIPARYGLAARRMINKMVYEILKNNTQIEGKALFCTQHGNLGAVDLTVAGLGTAKAAMARQKDVGNKANLNLQPAWLIVPSELEVQAAQLINSAVDPSKNNAAVNPFANKLGIIADPELTDPKEWYLSAAAVYGAGVEVTYLNGNENPVMESAAQFDTLGVKWRVYMDVGVNLLDYRGLYKSTGVQ